MSDVELMLRTYFHRFHDGVNETFINNLGIRTRDENGVLNDSIYLLIFCIVPMLKKLIQEKSIIEVYYSIDCIVGMRQRNLFIRTFLAEFVH